MKLAYRAEFESSQFREVLLIILSDTYTYQVHSDLDSDSAIDLFHNFQIRVTRSSLNQLCGLRGVHIRKDRR